MRLSNPIHTVAGRYGPIRLCIFTPTESDLYLDTPGVMIFAMINPKEQRYCLELC